jgi:phenylpropionate dioxygenase-like ring-hydroxylating dioxygenase large terminal subunit
VEGDGTLLCSYHGWRFDSEGKCTAIPQVSKPQHAGRAPAGLATVDIQHTCMFLLIGHWDALRT